MRFRDYLPILIAIIIAFSSCEKYNHIDNAGTVKIPYTLYMGGFHGSVYKTNDALYFNTLFYSDNSIVRQVLVVDSVVMNLKENFYYSDDDGKFFHMSNNNCIDQVDSFNSYFFPNNAVYDYTTSKVYLVTKGGIEFSTNLGHTFTLDVPTPPNGKNATFTSVTQCRSGLCYAMLDSALQFVKQPGNNPWTQVVQDGVGDLPLDTPSRWYISHFGDTLMAVDFMGVNGVRYSTDQGLTWTGCSGLSTSKRKILFGHEAENTGYFYVGYDSAGLYRTNNGNTFTKVSAGIPWYAKVGFVESKKVTYRTDVVRNYMFAATDIGLYWSQDGGLNWEIIRKGSYSTLQ